MASQKNNNSGSPASVASTSSSSPPSEASTSSTPSTGISSTQGQSTTPSVSEDIRRNIDLLLKTKNRKYMESRLNAALKRVHPKDEAQPCTYPELSNVEKRLNERLWSIMDNMPRTIRREDGSLTRMPPRTVMARSQARHNAWLAANEGACAFASRQLKSYRTVHAHPSLRSQYGNHSHGTLPVFRMLNEKINARRKSGLTATRPRLYSDMTPEERNKSDLESLFAIQRLYHREFQSCHSEEGDEEGCVICKTCKTCKTCNLCCCGCAVCEAEERCHVEDRAREVIQVNSARFNHFEAYERVLAEQPQQPQQPQQSEQSEQSGQSEQSQQPQQPQTPPQPPQALQRLRQQYVPRRDPNAPPDHPVVAQLPHMIDFGEDETPLTLQGLVVSSQPEGVPPVLRRNQLLQSLEQRRLELVRLELERMELERRFGSMVNDLVGNRTDAPLNPNAPVFEPVQQLVDQRSDMTLSGSSHGPPTPEDAEAADDAAPQMQMSDSLPSLQGEARLPSSTWCCGQENCKCRRHGHL